MVITYPCCPPRFELVAPLRPLGLLALALACSASSATAQQVEPSASAEAAAPSKPSDRKYPPRLYRAARLDGQPPVIDGRLDDGAWNEGEWTGNFTQQIPTEGAAPSQPTDLKILYDGRHLYFAMRAHDEPGKVHRYPGRRDDMSGDIMGICFDSYNDKRTGFEFDLTAGGSKIDLILGNGETEWDTTWDAVWDGEVAHDDQGWTAEFRVPLSQLRYGDQEQQVWGLHAWRWIDRNQEEVQWQLIPRKNSGRMRQLGELHGLRDLPHSRRVELLPHVVGSLGPARSDAGRAHSSSAGLDAKVGLGSSFTLDATVNPDFGQVEADPSVVNLSAYETFYEEKRPFFLEGKKILTFGIEDSDQLFYSRRLGHAPSLAPHLAEGERLEEAPAGTTILSALKITGKTNDGLSLGILQSLTQAESARFSGPRGAREQALEPSGSYTVARLHKDWDKGNASLGGMVTQTHRSGSNPQLAFLPTNALTAGIDFSRYFANRSWLLEASGIASRVTGDPMAIEALEMNAVHYYQRPDAEHLFLPLVATSLSGHGGSLRFGRSGKSRFQLTEHLHWYSPGLELNDLGYLRQADLIANQIFVGWSEAEPRGVFRTYSGQLSREDQWDFSGLSTHTQTALDLSAQFKNKWNASTHVAFVQAIDTRALRGGPALRWHDYYTVVVNGGSDGSRRVSANLYGELSPAVDDDSRYSSLSGGLNVRLSNRLSLSGHLNYEGLLDNLQYAGTTEAYDAPRWLLGRIDQETWSATFRVNLALTPNLTVQYYGSPFVGTGTYMDFKRATAPLAKNNTDRFHLFGPDEIAFVPEENAYRVAERGALAPYTFANPDYSFRQFRSNLVVRWELRPGSALYVVWSQGRTGSEASWDSALSSNWNALWRTRPDNVFLVKLSYWFAP